MAHMLFERITTAVRVAYAGRDDLDAELEAAGRFRRWAEGLVVEPAIRAGLVEHVAAVERGLQEAHRQRPARDASD